jgi:predicted RNase H-like HicB family nuclease
VSVYRLYLESGPKHKKTLVYVLDLLGCVVGGPTTEATLEATPDAIRAFLRFLARHGQPVDPAAEFETKVTEHIAEGIFLGNGDPTLVFGPDRLPLTPDDGET